MNLGQIDGVSFAREVALLRKQVYANMGQADIRHLRRIEWAGRMCTLVGYGTAWWLPNPVSAFLISQGNLTRWLLMHHIGHRGYDKVPGIPARYTSQKFAVGWRRFIDWFDWILPAAWKYEHNTLHHYNTGELQDPDLVEHNMQFLRNSKLPFALRYALVALFALTWKIAYYAPNTYLEWANAERRRRGEAALPGNAMLFDVRRPEGRQFWRRCLLPYGLMRFAVLPTLFAPLGARAVLFVLVNSLLAEFITNLHSFMVIGPNHSGDDLYRFDSNVKDRGEFFVRQVIGSVNYACGTDKLDYPHAWLNYQIEHHVWPDITMLQYQWVQPKLKAMCASHGIPYVQEGVLRRCRKLLHIMVGRTSMRRASAVSLAPQRLQTGT